jgi:hypothetical protein
MYYNTDSRFICIKCGKENKILTGIHRYRNREYLHVKDVFCLNCNEVTKNVEVRIYDEYEEVNNHLPELYNQYYNKSE